MEYLLIDHTGLIYGPYETLNLARGHAEDFPNWEIVNEDGDLFDWAHRPSEPTEPALLKAA